MKKAPDNWVAIFCRRATKNVCQEGGNLCFVCCRSVTPALHSAGSNSRAEVRGPSAVCTVYGFSIVIICHFVVRGGGGSVEGQSTRRFRVLS